jgi:hypothetical protein
MNVQQLLDEILAPESRACRNERDAAAELKRLVDSAVPVGPRHALPAQMVYAYYQRVHIAEMGSNLVAAGA